MQVHVIDEAVWGLFLDKGTKGEEVVHACAKSLVFGLCSAEGNFCLEFTGPRDRTSTIYKHKTCSWETAVMEVGISMMPSPSKVSIGVSIEGVIQSGLQNESLMASKMKLSTNVFDCFLVKKMRLVRKFSTLMNSKWDVTMSVSCNEVEFTYDRVIVPCFLSW